MPIEEILSSSMSAEEKIKALSATRPNLPKWGGEEGLVKQYDPRQHPVMDKGKYPDIVQNGTTIPVTRITLDFQRLATKRMAELVCGIPVKRVYKPQNDRQQLVADLLESIYERNRIDTLNTARCIDLFAACETLTLWYAVEQPNTLYGVESKVKLRCRTYSPMRGEDIYPLFDEYGDMQAVSVAYTRTVDGKVVKYFDTYTATRHLRWSDISGSWQEEANEAHTLGKIPAVYAHRSSPIWEHTSGLVYEMEWALSRNGNYLRDNSKPLFVVFADENIAYGTEQDTQHESRGVLQFPKGSTAQYVTWAQSVETLKFHIEQLRSLFFAQLQLPDWSYEKMSQQALSGESRKQMFIDSQLKVKDESGRLLEMFDRELNVLRAFALAILGQSYAKDIEALEVEHIITPFAINDEADTIKNLLNANGQQPLISHLESIQLYGHSKDPEATLQAITEQRAEDATNPAL